MVLTHCGATYECAVAVKCETDGYIRLYDAGGAEIAAFYNISDFSDYSLSGGSFVAPCDCNTPIPLKTYAIKGRTISASDWILSDDSTEYYYEIESGLISANVTTCNVLLFFANGTEFEYRSAQEAGKIVLYTEAAPLEDVVINSIVIMRA